MDKIEELLKEKSEELENIKAPDCLEEKLREALNKNVDKKFKYWKTAAIAASLVLAVGLGSLSFISVNLGGKSKPAQDSVSSLNKLYGFAGSGEMDGSIGDSETGIAYDQVVERVAVTNFNKDIKLTLNESVESQTLQNNSTKKIIKNADVIIEARKADETSDKIAKWVNSNGGYEFSRSISANGTKKQVKAVFKIPPSKLDSMLIFLKDTGKVTNSQTTSSDITDQYHDSFARLESLKAGRAQLIEVMKKATTIEDILKVQNELNRITADIEALQGKINMWDKQLAESSVSLLIYEEGSSIKTEDKVDWKFNSFSEIVKSMKNGFIKSTNGIFSVLVWMLVFLTSSIPVLLPIGIVVFIVWTYIKKRRKI